MDRDPEPGAGGPLNRPRTMGNQYAYNQSRDHYPSSGNNRRNQNGPGNSWQQRQGHDDNYGGNGDEDTGYNGPGNNRNSYANRQNSHYNNNPRSDYGMNGRGNYSSQKNHPSYPKEDYPDQGGYQRRPSYQQHNQYQQQQQGRGRPSSPPPHADGPQDFYRSSQRPSYSRNQSPPIQQFSRRDQSRSSDNRFDGSDNEVQYSGDNLQPYIPEPQSQQQQQQQQQPPQSQPQPQGPSKSANAAFFQDILENGGNSDMIKGLADRLMGSTYSVTVVKTYREMATQTTEDDMAKDSEWNGVRVCMSTNSPPKQPSTTPGFTTTAASKSADTEKDTSRGSVAEGSASSAQRESTLGQQRQQGEQHPDKRQPEDEQASCPADDQDRAPDHVQAQDMPQLNSATESVKADGVQPLDIEPNTETTVELVPEPIAGQEKAGDPAKDEEEATDQARPDNWSRGNHEQQPLPDIKGPESPRLTKAATDSWETRPQSSWGDRPVLGQRMKSETAVTGSPDGGPNTWETSSAPVQSGNMSDPWGPPPAQGKGEPGMKEQSRHQSEHASQSPRRESSQWEQASQDQRRSADQWRNPPQNPKRDSPEREQESQQEQESGTSGRMPHQLQQQWQQPTKRPDDRGHPSQQEERDSRGEEPPLERRDSNSWGSTSQRGQQSAWRDTPKRDQEQPNPREQAPGRTPERSDGWGPPPNQGEGQSDPWGPAPRVQADTWDPAPAATARPVMPGNRWRKGFEKTEPPMKPAPGNRGFGDVPLRTAGEFGGWDDASSDLKSAGALVDWSTGLAQEFPEEGKAVAMAVTERWDKNLGRRISHADADDSLAQPMTSATDAGATSPTETENNRNRSRPDRRIDDTPVSEETMTTASTDSYNDWKNNNSMRGGDSYHDNNPPRRGGYGGQLGRQDNPGSSWDSNNDRERSQFDQRRPSQSVSQPPRYQQQQKQPPSTGEYENDTSDQWPPSNQQPWNDATSNNSHGGGGYNNNSQQGYRNQSGGYRGGGNGGNRGNSGYDRGPGYGGSDYDGYGNGQDQESGRGGGGGGYNRDGPGGARGGGYPPRGSDRNYGGGNYLPSNQYSRGPRSTSGGPGRQSIGSPESGERNPVMAAWFNASEATVTKRANMAAGRRPNNAAGSGSSMQQDGQDSMVKTPQSAELVTSNNFMNFYQASRSKFMPGYKKKPSGHGPEGGEGEGDEYGGHYDDNESVTGSVKAMSSSAMMDPESRSRRGNSGGYGQEENLMHFQSPGRDGAANDNRQ
ncbi:hypothetical protein BGW38_003601 [Lunasporangiospora selenospora]|uniref:Uncharacterized protein n=1 Tax=Lunasporangiospora selenospora TaxID=979761 RepID=A0A9P6FSJ1_9FUNG|nr:hypothetical protein BGW38_003601 [Lunasporangiospora selenospora]